MLDGFVNINKPVGWTSHDVVAKLRGQLKTKKVGHAGTLDPQVSGVLPVALGRATKLLTYIAPKDKVYVGIIKFKKIDWLITTDAHISLMLPVVNGILYFSKKIAPQKSGVYFVADLEEN